MASTVISPNSSQLAEASSVHCARCSLLDSFDARHMALYIHSQVLRLELDDASSHEVSNISVRITVVDNKKV